MAKASREERDKDSTSDQGDQMIERELGTELGSQTTLTSYRSVFKTPDLCGWCCHLKEIFKNYFSCLLAQFEEIWIALLWCRA